MYTRARPPKPWRLEHDLTTIESKPQYQDKFDKRFWPKNGFIDDFIQHTYGRETTNLFAFWTAVAGLSGIIQRDCSLKFGHSGLFANFYVVLVAPPGLCHKSTAMNLYEQVERTAMGTIDNPDLVIEKSYKPIKGKVTAEALFDAMANQEYTPVNGGETKRTSAKMVARISELTTMLSKAQYNAQLVDKLTDFYDCNSIDTDVTRGGGAKVLHNIYASMFAATTPDHLKHSIPEQAFGGGFMSRTIIVNQPIEDMKRIVPIPYIPPECPDEVEMGDRLAWLIRNKHGQYMLSKECFRFYEEWYSEEITGLREKASTGETDHRNNRKYIHVLKLALLLAIQRYDMNATVELEDLKMAISIMEYTFNESTETVDEIYLAGIEDGGMYRFLNVIRKAGDEGVPRISLARNNNFKRHEIDQYLGELGYRGLVEERREETGEKTPRGKVKTIKKIFYTG